MARLLSILLIAFYSLSLSVISLHNHEGPEDHYTCSFCLLVQDFSAAESVLKPVLIIPQVKEAVFIPKSCKSHHALISLTVDSRAPPT